MLEKACERAVLLPGPRARTESAVFAGYVGKRRRKSNRFSTLNLVENGSENVIDVPKSLSRIAGYIAQLNFSQAYRKVCIEFG